MSRRRTFSAVVSGLCVAAMAGAAGLDMTQPSWWIFIIAGNVWPIAILWGEQ